MKNIRFSFQVAVTLLGVFAGFSIPVQAQPKPEKAKSQNPSLRSTRYMGFKAYCLSDGRSEAIIVPALGRIMRYALVGKPNLLWNSASSETDTGTWRNWGGDKSWPSPQSQWPISIGRDWPPHPSWDGQAYSAEVLPLGRLRITSGVWPRFGCRLIREFSFETNGDFVVAQTYEKVSGPPTELALWSITQVAEPQAIFAAANPQSPYKNGYYWLTKPEKSPEIVSVGPDLLRVRSQGASPNKIGVDAPVSSVVVVKDGIAFRQRAATPAGRYPDGAQGNGFPVEIFDIGGAGNEHYMETELLSPLRLFYIGSRWTHSVRWSLHTLQNKQIDSPESVDEIRTLMQLAIKR